MHMAKILTFPELVTEHNIARLRQNVLNGEIRPLQLRSQITLAKPS